MTVDNVTDNVNSHHIDPASTDTVHHEPTTSTPTPSSRPQVTQHSQFEALAENNPPRPQAQDNTGLRLNADSAKLAAFKNGRGAKPMDHMQQMSENGVNVAGSADNMMDSHMEKMLAFELNMGNRQMFVTMVNSGLEFVKHLTGQVAKQSEPIR